LRLTGEPRSPIGQAICGTASPPVHSLSGGRRVACHFPLSQRAEAA
jgi:hypothetical protein